MKRTLLLITCIMFLCAALSSPHNGNNQASKSELALQNANIHVDCPVVIPLISAPLMLHPLAQTPLMPAPLVSAPLMPAPLKIGDILQAIQTNVLRFTHIVAYRSTVNSTLYYRNFYTNKYRKPHFQEIYTFIFHWK